MSPAHQNTNADAQPPIAVIGAGIVGICCAMYLQQAGQQVVLFDPEEPGSGASSGNAGLIVQGACSPEASQAGAREVLNMLLDPLGALTIRPSHLPRMIPWFLHFLAASRPHRIPKTAAAMYALNRHAVSSFAPLIKQAKAAEWFKLRPRIDLFESPESLAGSALKQSLLKKFGVSFQVLNGEEMRELEPGLAIPMAGGLIYSEDAYSPDPYQLARKLVVAFLAHGGQLVREKVRGFEFSEAGVGAIRTTAGRHPVAGVVVAAGAYSVPLAKQLGCKVSLQGERGYHTMLPNPGVEVKNSLLSQDRHFAITPMKDGLRLAGTAEFAKLDAPPNYARADKLVQNAQQILGPLNTQGATQWMGTRPATPDSLPIISPTPHKNAFLAFGHGHLGLTGAAITGQLIAQLVTNQPTATDTTPYHADRFK